MLINQKRENIYLYMYRKEILSQGSKEKLGEKSTAENYGVSSEPCPFTKF